MSTKLHSNENGVKKISKSPYPKKAIHETLTNGFFTVDKNWIVKYWPQSPSLQASFH